MPAGTLVIAAALDFLRMLDHDTTLPLPTLRVGYELASRVTLEVGAGGLPTGYGGFAVQTHLGAKYAFTEGAVRPHVFARGGVYHDNPDEGSTATMPFLVGGAGLTYVRASGFTAWLEGGAGVMRYANWDERALEPAVNVSLGIGYRR